MFLIGCHGRECYVGRVENDDDDEGDKDHSDLKHYETQTCPDGVFVCSIHEWACKEKHSRAELCPGRLNPQPDAANAVLSIVQRFE